MFYNLILIILLLFLISFLFFKYYLVDNFKSIKYDYFINSGNKKIIKNKLLNNYSNSKYNNVIPKLIIQTYKDNKVDKVIYENINRMLDLNKNYSYLLITDEDGINLIKKFFNKITLKAFNYLNIGAAKGDFLRYIALYIYGGIYIDMDSSINDNLDNYIDFNSNFIFFMDNSNNLEQWCIITKPKNPIIKNIISNMVIRILNKENNIFLCTGPTLFTDIIYNMIKGSNIYDSNTNLSSKQRFDCFNNNKLFMGGQIIKRGKRERLFFSFRFKNYQNHILYPENDKYIPTWNKETPLLFK